MNILVMLQLKVATWQCSSGGELKTRHVHGMRRLVIMQLREAT
jgi:hypothetical protein